MSRVDEVRAELGEDNVNELMDAYYTSGLSLKDLRELYDLPKSFIDEKIVELFPSIEIEEDCPFCGYALVAPRLSRGIRGGCEKLLSRSRYKMPALQQIKATDLPRD